MGPTGNWLWCQIRNWNKTLQTGSLTLLFHWCSHCHNKLTSVIHRHHCEIPHSEQLLHKSLKYMGNISSQSHAPLQGSDKDNVQTQVYECTTKNMIKENIYYLHCLCYQNINHLTKDKTVDTCTLVSSQLLHMDFIFYNVTYIWYFSVRMTVVYIKSCMLCLFPMAKTSTPTHHHICPCHAQERT